MSTTSNATLTADLDTITTRLNSPLTGMSDLTRQIHRDNISNYRPNDAGSEGDVQSALTQAEHYLESSTEAGDDELARTCVRAKTALSGGETAAPMTNGYH